MPIGNITILPVRTWIVLFVRLGIRTRKRRSKLVDSPEGELLGVCDLEAMNGEVAYSIHETNIKSVTGKHALVLVFKAAEPAGNEEGDLMNLEWFTFATTRPTKVSPNNPSFLQP